MWDIVWVSPQGHRSVSVSRHFLLQTPQCPCSVRNQFSKDHCCRGRSKPGCLIVGSHTRWELTTWADFQLCLHRLLMSTGCKSSNTNTNLATTASCTIHICTTDWSWVVTWKKKKKKMRRRRRKKERRKMWMLLSLPSTPIWTARRIKRAIFEWHGEYYCNSANLQITINYDFSWNKRFILRKNQHSPYNKMATMVWLNPEPDSRPSSSTLSWCKNLHHESMTLLIVVSWHLLL